MIFRFNDEVWKVVPSAPHLLASSLGRIMVEKHTASMPNGGTRQYGGWPSVGFLDSVHNRYIYRSRGKTYKVARLVCEAFNGTPPCRSSVCMHLDENPTNNMPDNLSWGTQKENLNAPNFLLYCKSRTGNNNPYVKGKYER